MILNWTLFAGTFLDLFFKSILYEVLNVNLKWEQKNDQRLSIELSLRESSKWFTKTELGLKKYSKEANIEFL